MSRNREYILCAAIHYKTGATNYVHQPINITDGVVICGRRHCNCIFTKSLTGVPRGVPTTEGFITNRNRFVDRKTAAKIAYDANQIDRPLADEDGEALILLSEDLY